MALETVDPDPNPGEAGFYTWHERLAKTNNQLADALAPAASGDLLSRDANGDITTTPSNTYQEALSVVHDVTHSDYGAVGDGATDDSGAIQAAIDAVFDAGGGIVFLPRGTYRVETGLLMPQNPAVAIMGTGRFSVIDNATSGGDALSFDPNGTGVVSGQYLGHFRVTSQAGSRHGLYFNNADNGFRWCLFEHLQVEGADETGSVGILAEGLTYNAFRSVAVRDFDTDWRFQGTGPVNANNELTRCLGISNNTAAFDFQDCRGFELTLVHGEGTCTDAFRYTRCDNFAFLRTGTEDAHAGADHLLDSCNQMQFFGCGAGTNPDGDGFSLINTVGCEWFGGSASQHSGTDKYAVKIDADSEHNHFWSFRVEDGLAGVDDQGVQTLKFFLSGALGAETREVWRLGGQLDAPGLPYPIVLPIGSFTAEQSGAVTKVGGTGSNARRGLSCPSGVKALFPIEYPIPVKRAATVRIRATVINESTNSGDVVWRFGWSPRSEASANMNINSLTSFTATAEGQHDRQVIESGDMSVADTDDLVSLFIQRIGDDGNDTLSGDMSVVHMTVVEV